MTQEEILNDIAAERAVLAGLCQYGIEVYAELEFLSSEHFYDTSNQILFQCIKACFDADLNIELSSIWSKSIELGFDEMINNDTEISYIRSLFNFPIHKNNVFIYAAKLAKIKLIKDAKFTLGKSLVEIDVLNGNEEISDILSAIENPIQSLISSVYNTSHNKPIKIGENIEEYIQTLIDNPSSIAGVSSGFPMFDQALGGGLRRKCFDVVGARTGVGKSMFADAVALHNASKGIPVLMLDTEMDSEDHQNRLLANLSSVPSQIIATGSFRDDPKQEQAVKLAGKKIKNIPYSYINVSGRKFDYILAIMKQWIYQEVGFNTDGTMKDCLIIYDYLKMMDDSDIQKSMQEYQILGFQATQLHNFCVKYDVPCLTFIQLNRDGVSKETTEVAAGSDRIMWLCTSFSILKEKSAEEQADDRQKLKYAFNRKLIPVKTRHGGGLSNGDYVNIKMQGEFGRMIPGPTRNQLHAGTQTIEQTEVPDITNM